MQAAPSLQRLRERVDHDRASPPPDWSGDVAPAFVSLWVVSVAHVVRAYLHHEAFGTMTTLALLAIFLLPRMLHGAPRSGRK